MRAPALAALLLAVALTAPALAALPQRHAPQTYRGVVGGGVPDASYPVFVLADERIVVALWSEGSPRVDLVDPDGRTRESQIGTGRFELNAPVTGTWRLHVSGPAARTADYTLTVTLAPNAPYRLDEGLEPGDAPSSCGGSHLVREGVWSGGLWGGDASDTFRIHAGIGDLLTLHLKPDDLDDGADFSLAFLDGMCVVRAYSDAGNALTKSMPETLYVWPVPATGVYHLRVQQVNGAGNYHLSVSLREAWPTAPANDAGSGRDPSGPGDAVTLLAPGAYQARLHDGDGGDWFVVPRAPETTLVVSLAPGMGSAVNVRVLDASMRVLYSTFGAGVGSNVEVTHDDGPIYLAVEPLQGGGNYMLALHERPRL